MTAIFSPSKGAINDLDFEYTHGIAGVIRAHKTGRFLFNLNLTMLTSLTANVGDSMDFSLNLFSNTASVLNSPVSNTAVNMINGVQSAVQNVITAIIDVVSGDYIYPTFNYSTTNNSTAYPLSFFGAMSITPV